MRILSRCSDILIANINALLDKAENPEAMIGQIIREMEDDLAAARSHAASAIAAESRGLELGVGGVKLHRHRGVADQSAGGGGCQPRGPGARGPGVQKGTRAIGGGIGDPTHGCPGNLYAGPHLAARSGNQSQHGPAQTTFIDRPPSRRSSASGAPSPGRQAFNMGFTPGENFSP